MRHFRSAAIQVHVHGQYSYPSRKPCHKLQYCRIIHFWEIIEEILGSFFYTLQCNSVFFGVITDVPMHFLVFPIEMTCYRGIRRLVASFKVQNKSYKCEQNHWIFVHLALGPRIRMEYWLQNGAGGGGRWREDFTQLFSYCIKDSIMCPFSVLFNLLERMSNRTTTCAQSCNVKHMTKWSTSHWMY